MEQNCCRVLHMQISPATLKTKQNKHFVFPEITASVVSKCYFDVFERESERGKKKKKVSHGNRGRTQTLLSCSLSNHWLPPFLCSPGFTDNVIQSRPECLPQCPNMALPYPPHTYLNQSNASININKILQATGKLLHGCEV